MSEATMNDLEAILDRLGLNATLVALAVICHGKAEHVRTNWQDESQAQAWDHAAARIERIASTVDL